MLGTHSVYAQIQKRRRRSIPNSPASPSPTWQNITTTPDLAHAVSREELAHRGPRGSESPGPDADVPSFAVDVPSFSATHRQQHMHNEGFGRPQVSEEDAQVHGRLILQQPWPAKNRSYAPTLDIPQTGKRKVFTSYPLDQSFTSPRPSSSHSQVSPGPNIGTRLGDRAVFITGNHSHSSLATTSPVDETLSFKFTAGKKSRLNLLNPMSLLARRRSSQNQNNLEDVSLHARTQSIPAIPDDYDPRIRGNIIHDFSKPRSRIGQSALDSPTLQTAPPILGPAPADQVRRVPDTSTLKNAPSKWHSQSPSYSPVFTEHFQDDRQTLRPTHTGYLHSLAMSEQFSDLDTARVPAFAKKLPVVIDKGSEVFREAPPKRPPPSPPREITILDDDASKEGPSLAGSDDEQDTPLTVSKLPTRRKPTSVSTHRCVTGVPKHMTSTSSRFSFIGNGDSAAQEKILEERHKQHASNNRTTLQDDDEGHHQDEYYDYDLGSDDGLEERIPGVNADDGSEQDIPVTNINDGEEEENRRISIPLYRAASKKHASLKIDADTANIYARTDSRQAFHFTPQASALSSNSTGATSQPTPRDESGQIIGLADTSSSPGRAVGHQRQRSDLSIAEVSGGLAGLGLTNVQPTTRSEPMTSSHVLADHHDAFRDDDIYFDDGGFDDLVDDVNGEDINETIFDEDSEAVPNIPAENARKLAQARMHNYVDEAESASQDNTKSHLVSPGIDQEAAELSHDTVAVTNTDVAVNAGLTESNLAAYHAALVSATDKAAATGRFTRSASDSCYSETMTSQVEDSPPSHSEDKRNSHNVEFAGVDGDDSFDFHDEDEDEDDLIAEANAEVLENDDDGFYGQEFGFYARAKGKNTNELEYGGYFAPCGSNGIKRSHSAKANFQEPSLTPITERSEWSARNSIASLQMLGMPSSAQSIPSPGIAQLLDFESSSSFDEQLSFEALMKLRRGAFGGSSTSINSLGGPPSSSPLAHGSAHAFAGGDANYRMASSIHSLTGSAGIPESEEEEDLWDGPTTDREMLELRTPDSTSTFSPISARSDKRINHSRNSSGAESVSYVRDSDGRWLLERRRMSGGGEEEVIGREYLAASRI